MDVCLTNYGHCNYVSGKHACIFYDEVRGGDGVGGSSPPRSQGLGFCSVPWSEEKGVGSPLLFFPFFSFPEEKSLGVKGHPTMATCSPGVRLPFL